jgi:hypothetical protein
MRFALGLGKLPDDALLFPKLDGSPQSPRAFSKEWSDVAASVGLPKITFHVRRRVKLKGHSGPNPPRDQPEVHDFPRDSHGWQSGGKVHICSVDNYAKCLILLNRKGGRVV